MKNSKLFRLKKVDFWKGLLQAAYTSAFTTFLSSIAQATDFATFNWQIVVLSAVGGFLGYLGKNIFTNSKGEPFKKEIIN